MPRSTSTANWMIAGLPKSTNAFNPARMVRPVKNTSSTKTIFRSVISKSIDVSLTKGLVPQGSSHHGKG